MKEDPALDVKCKDKFLVQSAPVTADKEFESIATVVWLLRLGVAPHLEYVN